MAVCSFPCGSPRNSVGLADGLCLYFQPVPGQVGAGAKKVKGRFYTPVHVPASQLKLVPGEMSIIVLKNAAVSCEKIKRAGFDFQVSSLESAFESLK